MYKPHHLIKVILALALSMVITPSALWVQSMDALPKTQERERERERERDSSLDDVESYSKYYGVSFEETLYRFHIQDIAGELDAKLSENEANTFAGLWIEHTPKFKIVILFTQGGGENIDAYLTEELASLINVRPAKMSLIELQNAQKEAVASLWNIKILAGSEINVYENTIKVFIEEADKTRLDIALRHKSLIIPDYIKIITVTKLGGTV